MAYRFRKKDKSLGHGARRIAREQVDKAIAAIDENGAPEQAVREIRERCRRIISLLRLVRAQHGEYDKEHKFFHRIQRDLGAAGDGRSIDEAFRAIRSQLSKKNQRQLDLGQHESLAIDDAEMLISQLAKIRRRFVKARKRIGNWQFAPAHTNADTDAPTHTNADTDTPAPSDDAHAPADTNSDHAQLARAFTTTLGDARQLYEQAGPEFSESELHQLRKLIRTHWHHLRLFRSAGPAAMRRREKHARQTVQTMGQQRDLLLFGGRFEQAPHNFGNRQSIAVIDTLYRRDRIVLHGKACRQLDQLFSTRDDKIAEWISAAAS